MSYNHKTIEKNGKNIGQSITYSTPKMILKDQNFMHWICFLTHLDKDCT